ncbi:MAG: hypothetical protein PVI40_01020 [Chlamydiota bacterium]|jgi:hypothetical protein
MFDIDPRQISPEDFPKKKSIKEKILFLLNYAVLAPSNLNSQPWKFSVKEDSVEFLPDFDCWLKVSDPDKRELFISLGCALQNFIIAAEYFNLSCSVHYKEETVDVTVSELDTYSTSSLFPFITKRFTYLGDFKNEEVDRDIFNLYTSENHSLHFINEEETKSQLCLLSLEADMFRYIHPKYKQELIDHLPPGKFEISLMRFVNKFSQYIANRELPQDLQKNIAAISIDSETPISLIKVGQAFENIYLHAFSQGIYIKPQSCTLETPMAKKRINELLLKNTNRKIVQIFFYGYPTNVDSHFTKRCLVKEKLVN